jgi:hypothetical protein
MQGMLTRELYSGFSSGSYGAVITQQVNFARSNVVLQASMSGGAGASHKAGIAAFQGAEGSNFGDWPNWPNCVYTNGCIGVTFGVVGPGHGDTVAMCNVFFW